ncbi:transposase [Neptunomonas sp.]|uniref:transposase n=1 Tax=Neptunomonas sp. TaxID=1971898 RepID=UPI00344D0B62
MVRGLSRRWKVDCRHLSVDETSISKRHEYITILSNSKGQVLAIADGRASQSLLMCFKAFLYNSYRKLKRYQWI